MNNILVDKRRISENVKNKIKEKLKKNKKLF